MSRVVSNEGLFFPRTYSVLYVGVGVGFLCHMFFYAYYVEEIFN